MRNLSAAAWWLFALFCQAACAQTTNLNIPPEDLDSSGDDDDDAFSGSGAGSSSDYHIPAWNISEHRNASARSAASAVATVRPVAWGTEDSIEMVSSPVSNVGTSEAMVSVKEATHELDAAAEKPSTNEAIVTTRSLTTSSPVSVTTARAWTTVHLVEPSSGAPGVSMETLVPNLLPFGEEGVDYATAAIPPRGVDPTHEMETLSTEGSTGEQEEDLFFLSPGEDEVADKARNAEAAGTSQGIMDRKEVLGGVIAGGLVGLLFAVFLVGFMLYRMKKKDEGSYSLEEPKQSNGGYQKPQKQEEFYA